MIARLGVACCQVFLDITIDHVTVFSMRGDNTAVLDEFLHKLIQLAVIDHREGLRNLGAELLGFVSFLGEKLVLHFHFTT